MTSEALRSVEYVPGAGLKPVCAGDTLVRYRLGTHQPCALCDHRHRFDAPDGEGATIVFDAACPECPCRASGRVYEYGANDVLDYEHVNDYAPAHCERHNAAVIDADDCCGASFPRCIPGGSGGVEPNVHLRGERPQRPPLWLLRHLSAVLARSGWRTVRPGSRRGNAGGAGRDRHEDRRASTGRGRLPGVVVGRRPGVWS